MNREIVATLFGGWRGFIRKLVFLVLRVGPIPTHIACIMDGNRRYAKKKKLIEGAGYDAGAWALMHLIIYCFELGVKYLTVYAFSIDNFKRNPKEVEKIMDLMKESMAFLERIAEHYPVKVHFAGNLELLSADLRKAAKKLTEATAGNSKLVLICCVCYTCTDEITHAAQVSCQEKSNHIHEIRGINGAGNGSRGDHIENGDIHQGDQNLIKLADIEKHMYMSKAPDPDILIRTGDGYRLSNFLQWQAASCQLSSLSSAWPEFGFWHLVWVVLKFQRNYPYFERKRKHL